MKIDVTELVDALESSDRVERVEVDNDEIEIRAYTGGAGFVDAAWEIMKQHSHYDWYTSDYVGTYRSEEDYVELSPKSNSIDGFKLDG